MIKYMYVRSKPVVQYNKQPNNQMVPFVGRGAPVGCISYSKTENLVTYGVSSLNEEDEFKRHIAKDLATGRLARNQFTFTTSSSGRALEKEILLNALSQAKKAESADAIGGRVTKAIKNHLRFNFRAKV